MRKWHRHGLPSVLLAALGLADPWAGAQTGQAMPAPAPPATLSGRSGTPPAADSTVPLKNPRNRNPARRRHVPDTPPPPDPRDSTTRPVLPPDSDERDVVLPTLETQPPKVMRTVPR